MRKQLTGHLFSLSLSLLDLDAGNEFWSIGIRDSTKLQNMLQGATEIAILFYNIIAVIKKNYNL